MRLLCLSLSLLAACQASVVVDASSGASATPSEAQVRGLLEARHFDPDSPDARALAEAAAPALIALVEDAGVPRIVRVRALLAMRHGSGAETREALERVVRRADEAPPILRSAVDSLSRAFGRSDARLVIALADALASHGDASVRDAARVAVARARVLAER